MKTIPSLADEVIKEVRIVQGDRNGLLWCLFCHTLCSVVTADNDELLDLSARAVNETVTASSVFSHLFTRHVPLLRLGRRRITTTTRTKCCVQLLKKDTPSNYKDHALLHGRIISIDPYPLLSASVTMDYLYALLRDRLITMDHYRLSSVSVNYSQLLSPIQGLFSLLFLYAWGKPCTNTIYGNAAIWSCYVLLYARSFPPEPGKHDT